MSTICWRSRSGSRTDASSSPTAPAGESRSTRRRWTSTHASESRSVPDKITVVGAGHGGCAAAGDLGLRGFEVTLYNRSPERLAQLERQGGIVFHDPDDHGLVPIARLTTDIAAALAASSRVVLMVPTSGIEFY